VGAVMDQAYLDRGYDALAEKSLNPHNSFLQLAVGLGIIALLWFLFSLIYPLPTIYKNHLWIYGFFLLSIGLNFMVESMLEKQSGVIFFAFFNSFFYFLNPSVKRE
jgi:O-antigen ligase